MLGRKSFDSRQYRHEILSKRRQALRLHGNMRAALVDPVIGSIPDFLIGIILVHDLPSGLPQVGRLRLLGLDKPSPAAFDKADRHSITHPGIVVGDGVEAETARSFVPQLCDPLHRIFGERALGRRGRFAAQHDKPHGLAEFKHRRGRPEVLP
jgi:hypothetical protein